MATSGEETLLICTLTGATVPAMLADLAAAAKAGAQAVEFRLDYLADPPDEADLKALLADAPVKTIATYRPVRQGGHYDGDEADRLAILRKAAELGADYVDIEDDVPPSAWPAGAVIASNHDFAGCPRDLDAIAARLEASPAAVNKKVAFAAAGPEDALRAFDVLRGSRKPAIALAMGVSGALSRILAAKFGAFGTFASISEGHESAPGQLTLAEMRDVYRWGEIGPATAVYGVVGCPVGHSMSPAIHNAAFAAAGVDAVYVPLRIEPGAENFRRFMDALLARPWMDWGGLSVTIPHKQNALGYVGPANCDELACRIGAVNTITFSPDGALRGDNTDYGAALDALCRAMGTRREDLSGRTVAVLGAGGAARAIVAALRHYRAKVTIYNRTVARGEALAEEFGCTAVGMDAAAGLAAEILINCTPIGMHPAAHASPIEAIPPSVKVVFDTIYNPIRTRLLARAESAGCLTVSGLEMFVNQAVAQFELWTARPAPADVMRKVVLERLGR